MRRKLFLAGFIVVVAAMIVSVSVVFLIRQRYLLKPTYGVSFSTEQIYEAMQKAGGAEMLGKEAAEAVLRFGNRNWTSSEKLKNCPAIGKMASQIGGEIVGLWSSGDDVPAHIEIRRGGHFDYQFVYVFGTGSVQHRLLKG